MYFYASLLVAFIVTLIVISKIAEMLLAKRPKIVWVLMASVVGGGAAIFTYVLLSAFVKGINPMVMLIVSLSAMFFVSSGAFKYINKMSWTGAITTNVAHIVVALITMTAAVVLNGKSLEEEFLAVNTLAEDNILVVGSVASELQGEALVDEHMQQQDSMLTMDGSEELDSINEFGYEEEAQITERDFLPPSAVKALERKERVIYKEPKFHVANIGSVHTLVGHTIRILKKSGRSVSGSLKSISGSDVFVEQRIGNGVAVTPIEIAKIRKLEVYRR